MKRFLSLVLIVCLLSGGALPAAGAGRFSDIGDPETQRAAELLYNLNIIGGTGGDKYEPNSTFTRAMLAVLAVKLSGITDVTAYSGTVRFPDVRTAYWAHPWIMAAVELGIITGGSNGNYDPGAPMRYSYLTTVLMRLLGYTDADVGLNWPQSYIAKAEALGLAKGMKFSANDIVTRGQVARLIYNFLYMKNKEGEVFIEKSFQTKTVPDIVLSFEPSGENTVITNSQNSYTYRGKLDDSYAGKLASLLVDGEGNVLTVTLDESATYRTVKVREKRTNGLTLSDGSSLPIPTLGVWEWGGELGTFDKAVFWENEPVTLIYRNGVLLCVLRDSYENQIGAQFVKTILRIQSAPNGNMFAVAEDGVRYPLKGTINPALAGRKGNLMIDRDGNAISFTVSEDHTYQSVTVASVRNNGLTDDAGDFLPIAQTMVVWGETEETFLDVWEDINPGDVLLIAYDSYGRVAYIYRSLTRGSGAYAFAVLEEQPRKGGNTLTQLFGENVKNAVIYKNGVRAEADMLDRWDVLMYYETAGILEVSSIRFTGLYKSPVPNPQSPSKITLFNQAFDLLPEATKKMGGYPAGQRWVYLLSPDGRIADVRSIADVSDTTVGIVSADGVFVNDSLSFSGKVSGFGTLHLGKVCTFTSTADGISATAVNTGGVDSQFDVTSMKLGGIPVAPWCAYYDQVGTEGHAVRVGVSDIPTTRVANGKILHADISPSGYVTTIIMDNVTGDAFTYGIIQTRSITDGESQYMVISVNDGVSNLTGDLFSGVIYDQFRTGLIAGVSSGYAANSQPMAVEIISCKKYDSIRSMDFDGDKFVTLSGTKTPVASDIMVYIPTYKERMSLADARSYCQYFEVYTDPWGYKARFIIGHV